MWDDDLGSYWGLVRVDVVGPPGPKPWGGAQGLRRTGRFTTKDFKSFTPAEQVFSGRQGFEVYSVTPFRLPQWRAGYYMATASFYNTTEEETEGYVLCELLQTTTFGASSILADSR